MSIYRKIYEAAFGPIPKDSDGRTYEIHHIDGNHKNNDISNLQCVSIQEHFDIHFSQGDWAACLMISDRMNITHDEKSRLAKILALKRVEDGTHPFLGGLLVKAKVADGTHHFLGPDINRKRIEDGTHHLIGPRLNQKRIANGTHNFSNPLTSVCPYCGTVGKGTVMKRWHFDNCKK